MYVDFTPIAYITNDDQVFFAVIIGAFSLGNAGPSFTAISCASGVAANVFETIERKSLIDANSPDGVKLDTVSGNISFKQGKTFSHILSLLRSL